MKKILFVTWQRSDAIGIVDNAVKNELQKKNQLFDFLELYEKGRSTVKIIYNYIRNILKLLYTAKKYNTIYFSRENPFVIFIKFFYPKKKIIMTVHHVEEHRWKSKIWELIFKSVTTFIAISQFTKNQLMQLGIDEKDIVVNYNGIGKMYYPEPLKDFQSFSYFLYVGTEIPRKNTDTLLKAFAILYKKHPNIKLVKIGKAGTKEAQQNFDKKVEELAIQKAVIVKRDYISNDELRKWYSNALSYISLATLEGFGLTIPEAMTCGCPVIASNIWPFKEICWESQILVDPMDINQVVLWWEKYIKDSNFRKQMSIEGRGVAQKFSWEKNVEQLILLLDSK